MNKLVAIFIILLLTFCNKKSIVKQKNNPPKSLIELLGSNNFDSIGKAWKYKMTKDSCFEHSILIYDSILNGEFCLKKLEIKKSKSYIIIPHENRCLELCFKSKDSIFSYGSAIKKEDLKKEIYNYVDYLIKNNDYYSNFTGIFPGDDANKKCVYINLGLNLFSKDSINWTMYFNSVSEIINVILSKRDSLCQDYFKQPFEALNEQDRHFVLKYTSVRIVLTFNMESNFKIIVPKKLE